MLPLGIFFADARMLPSCGIQALMTLSLGFRHATRAISRRRARFRPGASTRAAGAIDAASMRPPDAASMLLLSCRCTDGAVAAHAKIYIYILYFAGYLMRISHIISQERMPIFMLLCTSNR